MRKTTLKGPRHQAIQPSNHPVAEMGYAHIPHLKARATMFIKRNGFATMDNFIELGLSRQYVSQLCTRGILRRSGLLYTLPGQD